MKIEITEGEFNFPTPETIPTALLDKFLADLESIKLVLLKARTDRIRAIRT